MHSDTPNSKFFQQQYTPAFVSRWDELINWEGRKEAENGFFEEILSEARAHEVLDIACGTGYHAVTLTLSGFNVTGSDGSAQMIIKAKENTNAHGVGCINFRESEWAELSRSFPGGPQFDAIICLGNAFTHLFEEGNRIQALEEIHSLLRPDGIAIIDQRNYDALLDKGYNSKHEFYYLGDTVDVHPSFIREDKVQLEYNYTDGDTHSLSLYPLRQDHLTRLLQQTGFEQVVSYGDFKRAYESLEPDFIIQVAKKF